MEINDETKTAIGWLRKLRDDARSVWESNHPTRKQRFLDVSPDDAEALVAHIDGEPARLAAACEEVREACARSATPREVERVDEDGSTYVDDEEVDVSELADRVRATPLDATPLADELRTQREATFQAIDRHQQAHARAEFFKGEMEELRGERDALRARVAELEAQFGGMTEQWKAELNHANAWMRKFRAAEAQVTAARKFIEDDTCRHDEEKRAVLRAMDEAAK